MNSIIEKSISEGKYIQIERGFPDRSVSHLQTSDVVTFDASICKTVYGWSESKCNGDVKGNIQFWQYPFGYTPTFEIHGVQWNYQRSSNESPPSLRLVIADSQTLYESYRWYLQHQNDQPPNPLHRGVYHFNVNYNRWRLSGTYRDTDIAQIVGMEHIFQDILADVAMLTQKQKMLQQLGLAPSLNYLLISNPGMGKTSLSRALATYLNLDIHTITSDVIASATPETLFKSSSVKQPSSEYDDDSDEEHVEVPDGTSFYIFEDFDRYLDSTRKDGDKKGTKNSKMASLLNALDGVENMPPSIRIFTANSNIEGEELEAFLSRMRRKYTIQHHSAAAYDRSISIIYPSMEDSKKQELSSILQENRFTMRQANNLLCASVSYSDPIQYVKDHLK